LKAYAGRGVGWRTALNSYRENMKCRDRETYGHKQGTPTEVEVISNPIPQFMSSDFKQCLYGLNKTSSVVIEGLQDA